MKRREFITNSSIAAVGLTTALAASCTNETSEKKIEVTATEVKDDFELNEITIPNSAIGNGITVTALMLFAVSEQ